MHVSLVVTVLVFWEQQKSQLCTIMKHIPVCIKRLGVLMQKALQTVKRVAWCCLWLWVEGRPRAQLLHVSLRLCSVRLETSSIDRKHVINKRHRV